MQHTVLVNIGRKVKKIPNISSVIFDLGVKFLLLQGFSSTVKLAPNGSLSVKGCRFLAKKLLLACVPARFE